MIMTRGQIYLRKKDHICANVAPAILVVVKNGDPKASSAIILSGLITQPTYKQTNRDTMIIKNEPQIKSMISIKLVMVNPEN